MLHIRYYSFSCTACGRKYTDSLSPFLLGTGRRRCKKCNNVFSDGSREWPQLKRGERFEYLFPVMALAGLGAAVLILGVAYLDGLDWEERFREMGAVAAVMVVPWTPYFMWRWHLIRKSKERFARRQIFGETDEFILPA